MIKESILLRNWAVALLCTAILLFAAGHAAAGEPAAPVKGSDQAAAFVLNDLDGRTVRLSDYRGKPVLLYFMASWCPQCRDMIPRLKKIHSLYSSRGLVFLQISVMESKEKMAAYAKRHDLPYRTLLDSEGKVAQAYGVFGLPVLALVDGEGRIICWNCRSLDNLLEKQAELK